MYYRKSNEGARVYIYVYIVTNYCQLVSFLWKHKAESTRFFPRNYWKISFYRFYMSILELLWSFLLRNKKEMTPKIVLEICVGGFYIKLNISIFLLSNMMFYWKESTHLEWLEDHTLQDNIIQNNVWKNVFVENIQYQY